MDKKLQKSYPIDYNLSKVQDLNVVNNLAEGIQKIK